jgi:hypothetical protein
VQICATAPSRPRRTCYEQSTQCPPTVPKPFVEAPSHTPKASTRRPRGRIEKADRFQRSAFIFWVSSGWRKHSYTGQVRVGAINRFTPQRTLCMESSRCPGGVLGIGLSGTDLLCVGNRLVGERGKGLAGRSEDSSFLPAECGIQLSVSRSDPPCSAGRTCSCVEGLDVRTVGVSFGRRQGGMIGRMGDGPA